MAHFGLYSQKIYRLAGKHSLPKSKKYDMMWQMHY